MIKLKTFVGNILKNVSFFTTTNHLDTFVESITEKKIVHKTQTNYGSFVTNSFMGYITFIRYDNLTQSRRKGLVV